MGKFEKQPNIGTPEFDFNGEECKKTITEIDRNHTYFKLAGTGLIFNGKFYVLNGKPMTLPELEKYADEIEEREKDSIYKKEETPEDKNRAQLYGQW